MSLVGSLEDLALGDILQIVSLSRKSGLLLLRSEAGDGRIFFRDGTVQAAYVKGLPENMQELLFAGGFVDAASLQAAQELSRSEGKTPEQAAVQCSGLSEERLTALCREHVERCVLGMFGWQVGEFSFEVCDRMPERDQRLALAVGLNPQYLTMEATRLRDEGAGDLDGPPTEEAAARGSPEDAAHEVLARAAAARASGEQDLPASPASPVATGGPPVATGAPLVATGGPPGVPAVAGDPWPPEGAGASASGAVVAPFAAVPRPAAVARAAPPEPAKVPLIVIDPELQALEWVKSQLDGNFARVHIFQHSEGGVSRVRQYLSRAELPVVLVSTSVPADRLTGASDLAELLGRLRAQAPRMPIVALHQEGHELPAGVDAADALVTRPETGALSDEQRREEMRAAGAELAVALRPWAFPSERVVAPASRPKRRPPRKQHAMEAALRSLEEVSEKLRDPGTRGEVLNLVLDFAARRFRRVAMSMVTDHEAVGIAQRGLESVGGPSNEAFCTLRVPLEEPAWFRAVIDRGESLRAGPSDQGDRRLATKLGSRAPLEAFVAPIESGGRVAALLYGDNLPDTGPIGDTTIVAIVLHEAGLALDRAVLERALEQARERE